MVFSSDLSSPAWACDNDVQHWHIAVTDGGFFGEQQLHLFRRPSSFQLFNGGAFDSRLQIIDKELEADRVCVLPARPNRKSSLIC
nr:hypothetical protein Iba_chr03cCG4660 [Ipomoea batatas]GME21296.1 hypothetical protein Iba_scaffold27385CG0020 [Ipomoea batatas]